MWRETIARLDAFSDPTEFERLCADVLVRAGFADIVPRGPAQQDGGADAMKAFFPEEEQFQFSIQQTWQRKLVKTVEQLAGGRERRLRTDGCLVFVTNQPVLPKAADRLKLDLWRKHEVRIMLLDREWLRVQLDKHQDLRAAYLRIPPSKGYKQGKAIALSANLANHFALPDFVRQLFTLAVVRQSPYRPFLYAYFETRIEPFVFNSDDRSYEILPVERSPQVGRQGIKITMAGVTETRLPVVEQDPDLPGLETFYRPIGESRLDAILVPLGLGAIGRMANTNLNAVTSAVGLVSAYCGTQFTRLFEDSRVRLGLDYVEAEEAISLVMRDLRQRLGRSWARAFAKEATPETFYHILDWSWADNGLERVLSSFLENVGNTKIKRLLMATDLDLLERTLLLLNDERIDLWVRHLCYQVASERGADPLLVKHLRWWAEHRPSLNDLRKAMPRPRNGDSAPDGPTPHPHQPPSQR